LPEGDPAIANSSAEIIREWTCYDLNAPAEWLNTLPASPELDRAVASYAFRVVEEDPENAMG
jgi:predicted phosphoadenosine phosphosulfate sulfurtransferase